MENRIRELREARHMTQIRLSIELEVTQETVSAYESGKHYPSYKTLVRLSELFGVSIDYLMGRSDVPDSRAPVLTEEEARLLAYFRTLSHHRRELAGAYLQGLADGQD